MGAALWYAKLIACLAALSGLGLRMWLDHSRQTCSRDQDRRILRYPDCILKFGVLSVLFFFSVVAIELAAFCIIWRTAGLLMAGSCLLAIAISLACGAASIYMVVAYFKESYFLTPQGMEYHTVFDTHGLLRWDDVTQIRCSRFGWFRVETADGVVVRVSIFLTHISEFAITVVNEISASAIDPSTERDLLRTANGQEPPFKA